MNRRSLLRGMAATALLAPFVHLPKARAAVAKRAMFVYVPDGCIPALWHPKGSETSFTLPEMSAPLESVKQHLVFLEGLTMYAGGATHEGGIAKVLTGVSPQSLDIYLGDRISADRPHRSLQLGVGTTFQNGSGSFSYIGDGQTVNPDDDPLNAFGRVFGSVSAGGGDDAAAALKKRQRMSVLDAALGDLSGLQTRLGSTEREKLDVHLDSLRELEKRLTANAMAGAMCDVAGFNAAGFKNSATDYYPKTYHKEENFKLVGKLQMDLATLALSCGSTNVVSLMWSHPVSPTHLVDTGVATDYYPKTYHKEENFKVVGRLQMDLATLALSCGSTNVVSLMWSHPVSPTHLTETGVATANHDASHYGTADSSMAKDFVKLKRWFMGEFAYLIQKLANTPDEGGSLLDNTLVLLCSELGDSNAHDHDSVPFVLAGKAGGALRTGRYLNYTGKNAGENEPHSKLLVSIANAVGVNIDSYGFTGKGKGPLPGLL
ncbi:MAG TPA: DUF1552 domain-containing protein [Polyangiales bacterium]